MPKVSVIIPVYGVEKYIERCARSLFEQTLDDIEYLFIDDCTPDKSIEVLKQVLEDYPHRKQQVIIHRMEMNCGQAAVRKWGMLNATGEYTIHCDSDDWVDVEMYESMYNKAKECATDLVICDFCCTDEINSSTITIGAHSIEKQTFIQNCLFQRDQWSLCNKLFRRTTYYKEIFYPIGALGEDMVICMQLLNRCSSIAYINKAFYNYYFNPTSITRKKTVDSCLKSFNTLHDNIEFMESFINEHLSLSENMKKQAISYLRMINSFCLLGVKHLPEYERLWRDNSQFMPLSFFFNPRVAFCRKALYFFSLFPFYPFRKNRAI